MNNQLQYTYECRDGACYLVEKPMEVEPMPMMPITPITVDEPNRVPASCPMPGPVPELHLPQESDEWTIYGTDYCGYCTKAKQHLDSLGLPYVYHTLTPGHRENLKTITKNYKYVPMIFNRGKFIGGFTSLRKSTT